MTTSRRITLATGCLALVLTAGCTDTTDPTDTDASGGEASPTTPSPTAEATAQATEEASPSAEGGEVTFSTLTGEATRLTLDDGVTNALSSVGVTLAATGGAQMETSGGMTTFTFPVSGGQATVDPAGSERFTGTVQHEGGLRLSALGQNVTADQLVLEGADDELTAMIGGRRVPLLPLATEPQITSSGSEQATVAWSAAMLDTSAVQGFADQLNLPALPSLEVNSLETTLEGS
jgi:hypothetical protein